ncbi:MAG: DEAD/DEAH box helicase [Brachybacterium sp.]|nr:DEAD/DEAH box helicase [Brachybacterium sp.]
MPDETPLPYVAEAQILAHVGGRAAERGTAIARSGAVVALRFEVAKDQATSRREGELIGSVEGSEFYPYAVRVRLIEHGTAGGIGPRPWRPVDSRCTCPVAFDCKHAAAMMSAATLEAMREHLRGAAAPVPAATGWREVLAPLLQDGSARGRDRVPLAIGVELMSGFGGFGFSRFGARSATVEDVRSGAELRAVLRPLRPGQRGNWIKGGLTWRDLQYGAATAAMIPEQTELLGEIVRLAAARAYPSSGAKETLRLEDLATPYAWQLLERAEAAGVPLVGMGAVRAVELTGPGSVQLDVSGGEGDGLMLRPTVVAGGRDLLGARPAGGGGFLLAEIDPGDEGARGGRSTEGVRVRLVPAAEGVPTAVQNLLRDAQSVAVPAAEAEEFLADLAPQLRRRLGVVSRDESVEIPETPPPSLRLDVTHVHEADAADALDAHGALLAWSWTYRAPHRQLDLRRSAEAAAGDRDVAGEDAILSRVREVWQSAASSTEQTLRGIDAARFVDAVLPRLTMMEGVTVLEHGERPGLTELTEEPALRISQVEPARPEDNDWFDLGFEITIGEREIPFTAVFEALSRGKDAVRMPDRTFFTLDHPVFTRLRELLAEAAAMPEWEPDSPRIGRYQVALWEEFEDLAEEAQEAVAWRRGVGALQGLAEIPDPGDPPGLAGALRPYQREGYAWLAFLSDHGLGGILADDMGLGKTVQTLAMILRARSRAASGAPPFLVIAPSSVLDVWRAEAERFAPGLDVRVLGRTAKKRGTSVAEAVAGADVVVTSYTLLRLDEEQTTALDWSGLILDEAQFVKNRAARAHRAAKRVRAPFRLAITGTPMENSLADLWALLSITAPGLFPSPVQFRGQYVKPIEAPEDTPAGRRLAGERMERLRTRIRPFLLRRTKEVVAPELPAKQEQVLRTELTPRHRRLYEKVLQRERQKLLGLVEDLDRNRFIVFRSLTLLRMLALDPAIVDAEEHAEVPSSKLEALMERLPQILEEGHRVIVFSQFTSFLTRIAERLEDGGVAYGYLDGGTRHRAREVARFRSGEVPVFLISLKAGGFGLTLTEADYVFLADPWWNPAAEAQAVDRAHRIGQDRAVMVYRMVAEDTIEEKVLALQERKAALFDSLTESDAAFARAITAEDVRALLEG